LLSYIEYNNQQEEDMTEKKREKTNLNLIMDREIYEDIKAVAARKRITVSQAFNEAGKLLVAQFDKEIAEGLR
jgi:hypothetical protein